MQSKTFAPKPRKLFKPITKKCEQCKKNKFKITSPYGHRHRLCAACSKANLLKSQREWARRNPAKIKAIKQRWLAAPGSLEKQRTASKKWRNANRERHNQIKRRDYYKHREARLAKARAWKERRNRIVAEAAALLDKQRDPLVTIVAFLELQGEGKSEIAKVLYPSQHLAEQRKDNLKKLRKRRANEIDAEIQRLSAMTDAERVGIFERARKVL